MRCSSNTMKNFFPFDKKNCGVISVILVVVLCSVRGVTEDEYASVEEATSGEDIQDDGFESTGDVGYEPTDPFSKPMKDHDEQRVRDSVAEHEVPAEVPVNVKIIGDLATPPPYANVDLGFIPKQTYYQVRRYDTEMHLPRSAALAEAETAEDVLNAPRLREVVSHKKTQEVYEEQGYEDAGYDHGGYKKDGEHHEIKLPREHKTDFLQIIDQSTEQSVIVNDTRVDEFTTESSHDESSSTTTEAFHTRKPRGRGSWSRYKTTSKEKNTKYSGDKYEEKRRSKPSPPPPPPHYRRRRVKGNSTRSESKSTTTSEPEEQTEEYKVGEESKVHTTHKLPAESKDEDIKPTTFHPPVSPKVMAVIHHDTRKKPKSKSKAKTHPHPFIVPTRITNSEYKFEQPFGNFKDFNEIKMSPSYPYEYKSIPTEYKSIPTSKYFKPANEPMPFTYYPPPPPPPSPTRYTGYRFYQREPKYGESKSSQKIIPAMSFLPPREPVFKMKPNTDRKYRGNYKPFPYEMISEPKKRELHKPRFHEKKPYKYAKVKDFPYEIIRKPDKMVVITTDKYSPYKPPSEKFRPSKYKSTKNEIPIFGPPDDSPWIPITPKEVYEIHGYDYKRPPLPVTKEIKVKADEDSGETRHLTFDRQKAPYTVTTSYKIKHVYPTKPPTIIKKSSRPIGHRTVFKIDIPVVAESGRQFTSTLPKPEIVMHTTEVPESTEDKDIETLSSNRYSIFQKVNYTIPVQEITTSTYDLKEEFNNSFQAESDKFLFRHPHLSKETSHLTDSTPLEEPQSTTTKRDIILTSVGASSNETVRSKLTKRNDIKPIIVYPEDYSSSASFVEKLTLAHYSDSENVIRNPLPLNYNDRISTLTNHLKNNTDRVKRGVSENDEDEEDNEELVKILLGGSTTQIAVDVSKYPFYKTTPVDNLSKYSVLRYISNPNRIPRKNQGRMAFYDSTDSIQCPEVGAPQNIVPSRENGKWAYNPKPRTPRIRNLGDKILCLKMKFFGSDPLDNPFFKEESIGYPMVFPTRNQFEEVEGESENDYEIVPSWKMLKRTKKDAQYSDVYKSPIRKWIDSLTEPRYQRSLHKRSAKIGVDSDKKVLHKVYLAGGFMSTKDNTGEGSGKRGNSIDVAGNEDVYVSNESTSAEIIIPQSVGGYGLKMDIPKVNVSAEVPSASTVFHSLVKNRKKNYVDATTSLRNLQTSSKTEPTPVANSSTFKYDYKEPTWRLDKRRTEPVREALLETLPQIESVSRPDLDSLLYVIDPKTGEGKWMKVVKVEDMENSTKDDSFGSENDQINQVKSPGGVDISSRWLKSTEKSNKSDKPCKNEEHVIKKDSAPEYDVYHITGLMGQTAPVKATEVEINNLQSTEEHIADISSENDGNVNQFYDLEDDFPTSTQFPEPHERLYYYVLDDETKER